MLVPGNLEQPGCHGFADGGERQRSGKNPAILRLDRGEINDRVLNLSGHPVSSVQSSLRHTGEAGTAPPRPKQALMT